MKTKLFFLLSIFTLLFSCDTTYTLENHKLRFLIFRYAEKSLKEGVNNKDLIITCNEPNFTGIHNYPKLYKNEPYFFPDGGRSHSFDICELATEEKVLALHNGWYTYFPYIGIHYNLNQDYKVRDGKWEDICNVNYDRLPILSNASALYSDGRSFDIKTLEFLTQKNRKKMTLDDITRAVNKIIDQGKVDKYTQRYW